MYLVFSNLKVIVKREYSGSINYSNSLERVSKISGYETRFMEPKLKENQLVRTVKNLFGFHTIYEEELILKGADLKKLYLKMI